MYKRQGDPVSREILSSSAHTLAELVKSVIDDLHLQDREMPIAKAGGTIGRSKFFDAAIDAELKKVAPLAHVIPLPVKPAEAAAKMAMRLGKRKGHG